MLGFNKFVISVDTLIIRKFVFVRFLFVCLHKTKNKMFLLIK